MKIAFIVSGNGYGHLRRVCEVVKHVFEQNQFAQVWILGASTHPGLIEKWGFFRQFENLKFTFLNVNLEWHISAGLPADYTFERYKDSIDEALEQIRSIVPDRIVSDNLVAIVDHFPSTLLMGSFLFSDTLAQRFPKAKEIRRICEYENIVLTKHMPVMLGVDEMAMPFVRMKTRFKGLPWFCTRELHTSLAATKKGILVTGGGTSLASNKLILLMKEIYKQGIYQVFLDSSLYTQLENADRKKFSLFDFSSSHFQLLDWIICRPGMGILTEAVRYEIPVCALDENDPEISHNARRVEELEIGIKLASNELIPRLDNNTDRFKRNLAQRNTGGALQAARYILTC
jgi:hypothetical protein